MRPLGNHAQLGHAIATIVQAGQRINHRQPQAILNAGAFGVCLALMQQLTRQAQGDLFGAKGCTDHVICAQIKGHRRICRCGIRPQNADGCMACVGAAAQFRHQSKPPCRGPNVSFNKKQIRCGIGFQSFRQCLFGRHDHDAVNKMRCDCAAQPNGGFSPLRDHRNGSGGVKWQGRFGHAKEGDGVLVGIFKSVDLIAHAHELANACQQDLIIERFAEKIICPRPKGLNADIRGLVGRQHNHRHGVGSRIGPQTAQQVNSGHIRQGHIDQNQIRHVARAQGQTGRSGGCDIGDISRCLQLDLHDNAVDGHIINYDNLTNHRLENPLFLLHDCFIVPSKRLRNPFQNRNQLDSICWISV